LGEPEFLRGEVMPLLMDDQRSEFTRILPDARSSAERAAEAAESGLTPAQERQKANIDNQRQRELENLRRRNERAREDRRVPDEELRRQAEERFPYPWERDAPPTPTPTPAARQVDPTRIPPGGLSCVMNSFRRLRLVATVGDWTGNGLPDVLAGDSGGNIYVGRNTGSPGQPDFGYVPRLGGSLILKVRMVSRGSGPQVPQAVEFMNYAMPFVCDWDGNGRPDLLVGEGTYSVNSIRWFRGADQSSLESPPEEIFLYVGDDRTFLAPFAYDWNGNGLLDLFVCDSAGRLTAHRRIGPEDPVPEDLRNVRPTARLAEPVDLFLEGGNELLAYAAPQPCDWNNDGIMDLIWSDPWGRILVALGQEKGGTRFSAPQAVQAKAPAPLVQFPVWGSFTGTAARRPIQPGLRQSPGGTASSERIHLPDGTKFINRGGWPGQQNSAFYGLIPDTPALVNTPALNMVEGDRPYRAGKTVSWAVAPWPGEIWEVVDESGPGDGKTLLLRWHDWSRNTVFRRRPEAPPQWTPGVAVALENSIPNPFNDIFTDGPITISYHMKLDGQFSRLDTFFSTNYGPLGSDGKPPIEGGSFSHTMENPPSGRWFEVRHTQPPHAQHSRGLAGSLYIMLLGHGEVRIRDVRVEEGR
jgi:hypothetical protein